MLGKLATLHNFVYKKGTTGKVYLYSWSCGVKIEGSVEFHFIYHFALIESIKFTYLNQPTYLVVSSIEDNISCRINFELT